MTTKTSKRQTLPAATKARAPKLRVGIVVPHIFMHQELLPKVIFSPAQLALDLAHGLQALGVEVTLFSPGPVKTTATSMTADLGYFEQELRERGDTYLDLLKKHPFTFVTLARQVQSELLAHAFAMANQDKLDVVHVYTNEEDLALPFAQLCRKPVVFTHHDPFNFLIKYKNVFPKYARAHWLSVSLAQRRGMPADTTWAGNIYHGIDEHLFMLNAAPEDRYVAYFGRIIEPKGLHIAIEAVKHYNRTAPANHKLQLRIAGKHYAGHKKDTYWRERIEPLIDNKEIVYDGFLNTARQKQAFLGNARALLMPSIFDEPFGMVMIEALACGTPIIGLDSGAIPEVITPDVSGILVSKVTTEDKLNQTAAAEDLAAAIPQALRLKREDCRLAFEQRFTAKRMCQEHVAVYQRLATAQSAVL